MKTKTKTTQSSKAPVQSTRNNDRTLYFYEGYFWPKGRLVLELTKMVIAKWEFQAFNVQYDVLQGYKVLEPLSVAAKKSEKYSRYFMDEVLQDKNGKRVCVCSQWTKEATEFFLAIYKERYTVKIHRTQKSKPNKAK